MQPNKMAATMTTIIIQKLMIRYKIYNNKY